MSKDSQNNKIYFFESKWPIKIIYMIWYLTNFLNSKKQKLMSHIRTTVIHKSNLTKDRMQVIIVMHSKLQFLKGFGKFNLNFVYTLGVFEERTFFILYI